MANKRIALTEICREYITKHPNSFKQTLARLIVKEHPELFDSPDHFFNVQRARDAIRRSTHSQGVINRAYTTDPLFMTTYVPDYTYEIPENLKIKEGKVCIYSDMHGYNSVNASQLHDWFEKCKDDGCNIVILNGDMLDFESISRWPKVTKIKTIQQEKELIQEFILDLKDMFPEGTKIIYKFGNHEFWWQKYIWQNREAMCIDSIEEALRLENVLELPQMGVIPADYSQGIDLGLLSVFHGHEAKKSGKYVANSLLEYYKKDVAFGHFHRIDKAEFKVFGGRIIRSYSLPCGRILDASYTGNNNQWKSGISICEFNESDYEMKIYVNDNNKLRLF